MKLQSSVLLFVIMLLLSGIFLHNIWIDTRYQKEKEAQEKYIAYTICERAIAEKKAAPWKRLNELMDTANFPR